MIFHQGCTSVVKICGKDWSREAKVLTSGVSLLGEDGFSRDAGAEEAVLGSDLFEFIGYPLHFFMDVRDSGKFFGDLC